MSLEDNLYSLLKLYKSLPYPIKYFFGYFYKLIPNRIKYGKFYFEYLKRIQYSDENTSAKLLKKHLDYVNENIPWYKKIKYKCLEDFPIIDKKIITENKHKFINSSNSNKLKANTGGSSGTPFDFFLEKGVSRPKEKAHFDWYWKQFGYKLGNKVLMIRGEALINNKLYEFQAIENKLAISCYLINSDNISEVIEVVNKFQPQFIHAYPSALKNFIDSIDEAGKSLSLHIKAVFLGSEGILHKDRKKIKKYFNTEIAHWYGHSERLIHAGNCLYSNEFHIFDFYGLGELVDNNNNIINEPNIKGRIVATGFDNKVMPLVRYDTGDEAEYSEIKNCRCGFKGRSFKKIYGRKQDYIFLSDRTKVSLTAFIFGQHFEEFSEIRELQIIQETIGEILIKIVLYNNRNFDENKFINKLISSVGGKLIISLKIIHEIKKTKRGKHIFLIQKISNFT